VGLQDVSKRIIFWNSSEHEKYFVKLFGNLEGLLEELDYWRKYFLGWFKKKVLF